MTTKPATPLPWSTDPEGEVALAIEGANGRVVCSDPMHLDAAYIVHAANSYPELVAALRYITEPDSGYHGHGIDKASALLAKLGEGK